MHYWYVGLHWAHTLTQHKAYEQGWKSFMVFRHATVTDARGTCALTMHIWRCIEIGGLSHSKSTSLRYIRFHAFFAAGLRCHNVMRQSSVIRGLRCFTLDRADAPAPYRLTI